MNVLFKVRSVSFCVIRELFERGILPTFTLRKINVWSEDGETHKLDIMKIKCLTNLSGVIKMDI